jgi:hypothetical protein
MLGEMMKFGAGEDQKRGELSIELVIVIIDVLLSTLIMMRLHKMTMINAVIIIITRHSLSSS